MQVTLLGPVAAQTGGVALPLGGRKQRSVFALLALNVNRTVSLDRLVFEIWRDEPPARATLALQAYVSRLRRVLAEAQAGARIVTRAPGWALEIPARQVDAFLFSSLVTRARGLLAEDRLAEGAAQLRAALELWQGEPLADLDDMAFVTEDAARLTEDRLEATELLLEADLATGQNAAVITAGQAVVATYPYRERAWRALILALYRAGRQADALATMRRLRETLSDGLGLDPSPQVQDLEEMILRHDATLTGFEAPVRPEPAAHARVSDRRHDPLVGRAAELDIVVEAVAAACRGDGRLLIINGPAGIGKSSVLARVHNAVDAAQGLVLRAAGVGTAEMPALWPWVTVVRRVGEAAPDVLAAALDGPAGDVLAMLDPSLGKGPPPPGGDAPLSRTRLYRAVIDLLRAVRARGPVAVLLDDAHWLDQETLDLLALAVDELVPGGVLFAVALRPDESSGVDDAVGRLGAGAPDTVVRLLLGSLDPDDVARIVARVSATDPDPAVVSAIAERTAGNPFFVVELTQLLVSERRLDPVGVYDVLPAGVREVLRRRLDRLPEQTLAVLTVIALLGRAAPVELLVSAASMTDDAVLDACEAAVLSGLLVDDAGRGFALSHDLVRQTLDEAVSPSRRVRWHARISSALLAAEGADGSTPERIVELANQLTGAVPVLGVDLALQYVLLAADDAYNRMALGRSEDFLNSALVLAAQIADPPTRTRRTSEINSRLTTGRIMFRGARTQPVGPASLHASSGIAPLDPESPGDWYNAAIQLVALGENHALLAAARAEMRAGLAVIADAYVHFFLAMGCFELGRPDEARAAFLRGEQLHQSAPDLGARPILFDVFVGATHGLLAAVETVRGDAAAAAEQLAHARALPEPNLFVVVTVEFWAAWCASQRGDYESAGAAARECAEHASGFFYEQGSALLVGWAAAMMGDPAGLPRAAAAFEEYVALGVRHQVTTYLVLLAEAQDRHGHLDRARDLIRESREWTAQTGEQTLGPRLRAFCDRLLPA